MWKPFLLEILESDTNPTLNSDITLGGYMDVCDHDTGECLSTEKSGAIDSSSFSANVLSHNGLVVTGTLTETISKGNVITKFSGGWKRASSAAELPGLGIALEDGDVDSVIEILIYGSIKNESLNIPEDKTILYLSGQNIGTSSADWVQVLGCRILDTDKLFFKPDFFYLNKTPTAPQVPV